MASRLNFNYNIIYLNIKAHQDRNLSPLLFSMYLIDMEEIVASKNAWGFSISGMSRALLKSILLYLKCLSYENMFSVDERRKNMFIFSYCFYCLGINSNAGFHCIY